MTKHNQIKRQITDHGLSNKYWVEGKANKSVSEISDTLRIILWDGIVRTVRDEIRKMVL